MKDAAKRAALRLAKERRIEAHYQKLREQNEEAQRSRLNFKALAADLGHSVSLVQSEAGWGWRCTCGVTGHATRRYDKAAQRSSGDEHVRWHLSD